MYFYIQEHQKPMGSGPVYESEMAQFATDFDDFGVVEKPWISAFQRRQNHQNPLELTTFIHGTFFDLFS